MTDFMNTYWGMLLIAWAPYMALGIGTLYLGGRFIRAFERRGATRSELAAMQDRLLKLEESVADIASSVDRVAEGQSFTTRVLAERSQSAVPEVGVGSIAPHDASAGSRSAW